MERTHLSAPKREARMAMSKFLKTTVQMLIEGVDSNRFICSDNILLMNSISTSECLLYEPAMLHHPSPPSQ